MTIKEKSKKFLELLQYTYRAQKKETVWIKSETFYNNGLDIQELEDLICPDLCEQGYLKKTDRGGLIDYYLYPERHSFVPNAAMAQPLYDKYDPKFYAVETRTTYWITVNGDRLNEESNKESKDKNHLKSIHLVTNSLEPRSVIFLVLDKQYQLPIRCAVKNKRGEVAYIKKLYDIAYLVDVPGKKVNYDRTLADSINNGLFRKRQVKKYMRTNEFKKPTLVQKSEDNTMVLKNEIPVKTILIKNIPLQYQELSLYIDKTK